MKTMLLSMTLIGCPLVYGASSEEETSDVDQASDILKIQVTGARGLDPRHKKTQTSSPYCKIIFGDKIFQTKIKKEELNPRWKETFDIVLDPEALDPEEIICEVWCEKTGTLLGKTIVPLPGHRDTGFHLAKEHWYSLHQAGGPSKRPSIVKSQNMREKQKTSKSSSFQYKGELGLKIWLKPHKKKETRFFDIQLQDQGPIADDNLIPEMGSVIADSQERVKVINRVTGQTEEIGLGALEALRVQGRKLDHAEDYISQMEEDFKTAKRELRGIHSVSDQVINSLTSPPSASSKKKSKKEGKEKQEEKIDKETKRETPILDSRDFLFLPDEDRQKIGKTEEGIDEISKKVGNLKNIANEMNHILDKQNKQLDGLQNVQATTAASLKKTREKVKREF